MFNLFSVVNGAVVDKPTSDFTGSSVPFNQITSSDKMEFIFLLILVFIAGMFTHYAYVKIKEYLKKKFKKDDAENNDKRE